MLTKVPLKVLFSVKGNIYSLGSYQAEMIIYSYLLKMSKMAAAFSGSLHSNLL